jgi:ankyrin repeat protein
LIDESMGIDKRNFVVLVAGIVTSVGLLGGCVMALGGGMKGPSHFFEGGSQVTLLQEARQGDSAGVRDVVAQGANIDRVGKMGVTPLIWLLADREHEGFVILLREGADSEMKVNLSLEGEADYVCALELSARIQDERFLQAALDYGANPNYVVSDGGQVLLHEAITYDAMENIRILLEYGADINRQNQYGLTPIAKAAAGRRYEIALLLLQEGADPTIENSSGISAIDYVREFGEMGIHSGRDRDAYHELVEILDRRDLLD